jgi:uncharacterized protein
MVNESVLNKSEAHKSLHNYKGNFALVAGGSKGIGYSLAEALAARNYNLVLIARHWDALEAAKKKLEANYPIHVELLSYDLSEANSAEEIANWCYEKNIVLTFLCNVVGLGGSHDFPETPLDTLRYMVRLNIESGMALTYKLIPLLEKNAPSYILNVASMAGLSPIPIKSIYSATKSAVIFFSYGLHYQLKKKNIKVSCLAPGPVFTKPEVEAETRKQMGSLGVKMAVPVKQVGIIAIRKTLRGKMLIVPGTIASFLASVLRILPRKWITAIYHKIGKK